MSNSKTINLLLFVVILEEAFKRKAIKDMEPMEVGDMGPAASCNATHHEWISYSPTKKRI